MTAQRNPVLAGRAALLGAGVMTIARNRHLPGKLLYIVSQLFTAWDGAGAEQAAQSHGDFIIQGAPGITAKAAGIVPGDVAAAAPPPSSAGPSASSWS